MTALEKSRDIEKSYSREKAIFPAR